MHILQNNKRARVSNCSWIVIWNGVRTLKNSLFLKAFLL
jgi:hypothetical protein